MFGLFKKKTPEHHTRKGVEMGEMREFAMQALMTLGKQDESLGFQYDEASMLGTFSYRGIPLSAAWFENSAGLGIKTTLLECNILRASTVQEKAFAYRCIDHVCFKSPGVRAYFHPESGDLVIGVYSAGFDEQFRADTLIDIALFMIEDAVCEANTYLGLPATPAEPVHVDQFDGGYHGGEGFTTYRSARDAFAAYMIKHDKCEEISRDEQSILLQSGPVQYDVRGFNWPNAYMVTTATRGFKHIYHDDERYVRVQERLAQPIFNPEKSGDRGRNFRDPERTSIAYFQPDGTFVIGQYGFGNIRTDANKEAFNKVDTAHVVDVYYLTYLAEELPKELYSDEANRPN